MEHLKTSSPLNDATIDQLFRSARTRSSWQVRPLSDGLVREIYELARLGPTATNCNPGRFVFVRTPESKARLRPHLMPGNVDKTISAPCCVIVAYDTRFHELMPELFPGRDIKSIFDGNPMLIEETARRNSTLQGAYLIIAARALGLDCGPMSGFNAATLDAEFFPDGRWKSNFLCNLGFAAEEDARPRLPRLDFSAACFDI
jgi:3-hydroxypropanoate dehydrogenase